MSASLPRFFIIAVAAYVTLLGLIANQHSSSSSSIRNCPECPSTKRKGQRTGGERWAVVFYSLTKNFRKAVLPSFEKHVRPHLPRDHDIFFHTWSLVNYSSERNGKADEGMLNFEEMQDLRPADYLVEDESAVMAGPMGRELKEVYQYGDPWDNNFKSVRNFWLALYSVDKAFQIANSFQERHGFRYTHFLFTRADLFYTMPFPIDMIRENPRDVYIPNFHHWGGRQDRIAVTSEKFAFFYARRRLFWREYVFHECPQFQPIHGELMLHYLIQARNASEMLIPFEGNRVRISGIMQDGETDVLEAARRLSISIGRAEEGTKERVQAKNGPPMPSGNPLLEVAMKKTRVYDWLRPHHQTLNSWLENVVGKCTQQETILVFSALPVQKLKKFSKGDCGFVLAESTEFLKDAKVFQNNITDGNKQILLLKIDAGGKETLVLRKLLPLLTHIEIRHIIATLTYAATNFEIHPMDLIEMLWEHQFACSISETIGPDAENDSRQSSIEAPAQRLLTGFLLEEYYQFMVHYTKFGRIATELVCNKI